MGRFLRLGVFHMRFFCIVAHNFSRFRLSFLFCHRLGLLSAFCDNRLHFVPFLLIFWTDKCGRVRRPSVVICVVYTLSHFVVFYVVGSRIRVEITNEGNYDDSLDSADVEHSTTLKQQKQRDTVESRPKLSLGYGKFYFNKIMVALWNIVRPLYFYPVISFFLLYFLSLA